MNRKDWDKSKKQMQGLLERGIEELKGLAAEASYMTDATSNVVKMEMDVHRQRTRLEKLQMRLGREVARTASVEGRVKQNTHVQKLIEEIRLVEKKIQRNEKDIKKVPLTWAAAKAAAKKMMGGSQKTAPRKKAARAKKSATRKRISKT